MSGPPSHDTGSPEGEEARHIGPYRIERLLGRGGMGEVYVGYDERLDRPVALKRVRTGGEGSETARRRFRREARAVARLHHSAIVQVHDWVETEDGDWIVMEMVEGRSLRNVLRDGPLDPTRAIHLVREILEGLAVAHAAGIVHRDLKPENVMVTVDSSGAPGGFERAKILDFGLAKRFAADQQETQLSQDGKLLGTLPAMSPEQLRGRPVDHRSDLFSLGTLCYEMVTGVSPFAADSPGETLHRICTFSPPAARDRRAEVPERLSHFIDHLLEKDPRRRPQSAREALAELGGTPTHSEAGFETEAHPLGRAGGPTLGGTPSSGTFVGAPPAWRRWAPALAAAVVLGLAVTGMLLFRSADENVEATYVAVPSTQIAIRAEESEGDPDLAAGAVHTAILRGLLSFRDLAAIEPSDEQEKEIDDPVALARALGADEVLSSRFECSSESCQVVLKRLAGDGGQVLWTRSFTVAPQRYLDLSQSVLEHLRSAYPGAELRSGVPELEVRPEDYEVYLRLRQRYEQRDAGLSTPELFERLGELERSSPAFLALPLFESRVLVRRYQEGRDPADLERARAAVERARAVAPDDLRVLAQEAQVARVGDEMERAEALLERIRRLDPGNAQRIVQQALFYERRGETDRAVELMHELIARLPSAIYYFELADMLYRRGAVEDARRALETGLELAPSSFDGRSRLAQLELLSGSAERAAELYGELVERSPEMAELTNLGTALLLLERWDEAAERFLQALELAPRSPFAALNLADAKLLGGRTEEAEEAYAKVLEIIGPEPESRDLLTVRAQALARLGREQAALAAIQEALRQAPDHPQVHYEAALVYTLIGDGASAEWHAQRARERGVDARWFDFPWFDDLRPRLDPG